MATREDPSAASASLRVNVCRPRARSPSTYARARASICLHNMAFFTTLRKQISERAKLGSWLPVQDGFLSWMTSWSGTRMKPVLIRIVGVQYAHVLLSRAVSRWYPSDPAGNHFSRQRRAYQGAKCRTPTHYPRKMGQAAQQIGHGSGLREEQFVAAIVVRHRVDSGTASASNRASGDRTRSMRLKARFMSRHHQEKRLRELVALAPKNSQSTRANCQGHFSWA